MTLQKTELARLQAQLEEVEKSIAYYENKELEIPGHLLAQQNKIVTSMTLFDDSEKLDNFKIKYNLATSKKSGFDEKVKAGAYYSELLKHRGQFSTPPEGQPPVKDGGKIDKEAVEAAEKVKEPQSPASCRIS